MNEGGVFVFLKINILNSCLNDKSLAENANDVVTVDVHCCILATVLPRLNNGILFRVNASASFIARARLNVVFNTVASASFKAGFDS